MISFSSFIYSDNYFLTVLDLWLLVNRLKIPTIFISTKKILQTNYNKNIFIGYGDQSDKFCFIVVPALRNESVPSYRIITSDKNETFIPITDVKQNCYNDDILFAFENKLTIEKFLTNFVKIQKPKPVKALDIKVQLESDD